YMSRTKSESSKHLHDPDFLSKSASLFNNRDVRALNVNFQSAQAGDVIPDRNVEIPQEYVLPSVNRALLDMRDLEISQLSQNNDVRTFINKLQRVTRNVDVDIGTGEAFTDTLVAHLLFRAINFDQWPMIVELHPMLKFSVGQSVFSAKVGFVINSKHFKQYSMLVVEDKHLANVRPTYGYGEPQIVAEMLACGDENIREAHMAYDMIIFVVRVVSTYVTFYRASIQKDYWDELSLGCPQKHSITIFRWPGNNSDPFLGFDLAESNGRKDVLEALCKIRQYIME
ncbi:13669_t:CDS:2, partial [Dentiscutata erythropus]